MRYVALLRGINVGGHKIIKMDDLRKAFFSLGFSGVESYKQSGNILFDTSEKDAPTLVALIKKKIKAAFGSDVEIFLHTVAQMKTVVAACPYKEKESATAKWYVTFFADGASLDSFKFPLFSKNKDVEVVSVKGSVAYCISRKIKGKSGYPNGLIESIFKTSATTRNWATVNAVSH